MTYLDSHDLESEMDDLTEAGPGQDIDDIRRRKAIRALREEVGGEWSYGVTLIPDDDFEDYARELAEDIGAIDREAAWPASHIDWEAAADSLRLDYSSATFEGTDYLFQ